MDRLERFVSWKDALLTRLRKRSWGAWAFVALLVVFIEEVIRSFFVQGTTRLLAVLWETLGELIARPMGLGGLALLIWAAFLFGLAYWDSRPRKAPPLQAETLAPRVLSTEEKEEIQALRVLWNLYFQPAVATCQTILGSVVSRIEDKKVYWWSLAQPNLQRLYEASLKMSEAVADDSQLGLFTVQARQNEAYGAYWGACYWAAKIAKEEGIDLTQVPTPYELSRWRERHNKFMDKLWEFKERPLQRDKIITGVQLPDDTAFVLLRPEPGPKLYPLTIEGTGTVTPPASEQPAERTGEERP